MHTVRDPSTSEDGISETVIFGAAGGALAVVAIAVVLIVVVTTVMSVAKRTHSHRDVTLKGTGATIIIMAIMFLHAC